MKMMKLSLYARVSSEKQAQEGTIESQVSSIREFVKEHGGRVEPDLEFFDNGISGASLTRPGLDRLRDRAFAGEISHIYVLSPDRLARKYAHQLLLIEEFRKLGVEVVFVNKQLSGTPEDEMLLQIQGVISEYEREKIMERSRRGKLHAAKGGRVAVLSGAPFGYVYHKKSELGDAFITIHPVEKGIVQEAFELYCKEFKSIGEIARIFREKGYATRTGRTFWERSVIWGMLRNPAYMGAAAFRKTTKVVRGKETKLSRDRGGYTKSERTSVTDRPREEWITIEVPPIVSEAIFSVAQNRLVENRRLSPRNNKKHNYLLSGFLICSECGYSLYGKPASNSRYKRQYYRCMGQDGHRWEDGRKCSGHPIRVEVVDDLVWDQVRKLIEQPRVVVQEYAKRNEKTSHTGDAIEDLLKKKELELRRVEHEKERLLDLYQLGDVSITEIKERLAKLRGKVELKQAEVVSLQNDLRVKHQRLTLVDSLEQFTSKLAKNLDQLRFDEKRKLVKLLVSRVYIDTKKEEIMVQHIVPIENLYPLCPGRIISATEQCCSRRIGLGAD